MDQADQKFSKPARSSTSSNASSSASDTSSQYSCQNKTFSIRARAITIARKVGSLPTPRINVTIQSSGQEFKFDALPDTGSTRTIVSYDIAKRYGLKIQTKQKEALFAANDQLMPCEGKLDLNISYMGRTVQVDAIVTSAMRNEVLISWHDLISLRVISHTFPRARVCNVDSLEKIQKDYPTVISNCLNKNPMTGPPMRIHLKEDVKPKTNCHCKTSASSLAEKRRQGHSESHRRWNYQESRRAIYMDTSRFFLRAQRKHSQQ